MKWILFLFLGGVCWGQVPDGLRTVKLCPVGEYLKSVAKNGDPVCEKPKVKTEKVPDIAKPLKCGKYQHIQYRDGCYLGSDLHDGVKCYNHEPEKCVDTMHEVTEREWQELMARLKTLETPKKFGKDAFYIRNDSDNAHYQCLYNYAKLSDGQQHACLIINTIEGREGAKP